MGKKRIGFEDAEAVAERITAMLEAGEFDVCTLIYNRCQSVITHVATEPRLIPAPVDCPSGSSSRWNDS